MKAIFEFDAPESCEKCQLMYRTPLIEVCAAARKFPNDALRREERACFCPLKIVSDEAPTVDAVPVVRCRNCKYSSWDSEYDRRWCNRTLSCSRVKDDDYCSYGAKMENVGEDREG